MTPTRIRWEDGIYGTNHLGYVGTLDEWTFQIFKPSDDADDNERTLMASLPGFLGRRCPGDDVEYLKAVAEKWLGEFVASLGAIFPADATDGGRPVTFRLHQDVAVVEHDPSTRQPLEGGRVEYGTVTDFRGGDEMHVRFGDDSAPPLCSGDMFWRESGWRVWDNDQRWRVVPLCHVHEEPILGTPYTEPGDPLGRVWCSEDCAADANEAKAMRDYENSFGG